ncbi:hypothetical protein AAF712_006869 [Marasmius tenuissimus]|uniref:Cytochrome P450 n=1 Tax=Marasmius tenuissimus TaxID=585030 RepID=A0ABR2ZWS3_9AGAR
MSVVVVLSLLTLGTLFVLLKNSNQRLNRFPGPSLARWTTLYKEYYETLYSDWVGELEKLHRQYGPIVRVGPNELHFSQLDAYGDIYAVGSKFSKDSKAYSPVETFLHLFGLLDPQEALTRRSMIQPFFSKRSVLGRQSIIQEKVDSFINELLSTYNKPNPPMDLGYSLRPFFAELIPIFCFPNLDAISALTSSGLISSIKQTPDRSTIWFLMKNLPRKVVKLLTLHETRVSPNEAKALELVADDALNSPLSEVDETNISFFQTILKRSGGNRPLVEPRLWLASEAMNLKFAGVDTTANAVFIAIRAVLGDEEILEALIGELDKAWPELGSIPLGMSALEKLPYMTAVIKEGLRLSMGVIAPMTRVVTPEDTVIGREPIPVGTIVGMSTCFVHLNPEIFPEPHTFRPERWLQEDSQKLEKYLVTFSRGPRSCVGMHFAWCMMYLLLANMFRKLKLLPTSTEDLRAPFRLKDDFVSVYEGKPVYLNVEGRRS